VRGDRILNPEHWNTEHSRNAVDTPATFVNLAARFFTDFSKTHEDKQRSTATATDGSGGAIFPRRHPQKVYG
jgi:hypothetical protein